MTTPPTCSTCGASPTRAKGLCGPCYQRERHHEQPATRQNSQRIERTAYLEEVAARDRAWRERHLDDELVGRAGPKMDHAPDAWMTYTETAEFWGVTYAAALQRVHARQMPQQRVGRLVLVQRAAVEAWRSRTTVSTSHPAIK